MKAYKTHMHLHTCFVQFASMASHAHLARELGFDALFITDHDNRMGMMEREIHGYDFVDDQLFRQACGCGWTVTPPEAGRAVCEADAWHMRLTAQPKANCHALFEGGKRQQAALLALVEVGLRLRLPPQAQPGRHGLRVDITLSQRPGDLCQRHLYYDWGHCPQAEDWAVVRPLAIEPGSWTDCLLPISQDMASEPFGQDNCFITLGVSLFNSSGEALSADCGAFWKSKAYTCEDVRQRQQLLADELGAHYGVKLYIAQEISNCGPHKNCFSPQVPVLDYRAYCYQTSAATAAMHLAGHDAVYSYNHMFEPWKRETLDEAAQAQVLLELTDRLFANRCEGATVLEVGFPEGRYNYSIEEHMQVWDALAERGVLLTGNGVSDSHDSRLGWHSGNNFATWLIAQNDAWPSLLTAMRKGRAYMGDPTRWDGQLTELSMSNVPMGSAFRCAPGDECPITLRLAFSGEPLRLTLRSHEQVLLEQLLEPGEHCLHASLVARRAVEPVRFELRGLDGRMVLASNPVYAITDGGIQGDGRVVGQCMLY